MKYKIDYIDNSSIDRSLWDTLLKNSANRRIYASSIFLDIFCPGWEAIIVDNGKAIMPVTLNTKFGISYLFQPIFIQQLGCFVSDKTHLAIVPSLLNEVSDRYRYIDICLNEANLVSDSSFSNSFTSSLRVNAVLNLNKSYEELANEYSVNTRRNIIKARRLHVETETLFCPAEMIRMFENDKLNKFPGIKRLNLKRLNEFILKGINMELIHITSAKSESGQVIASACFLRDYDRFVYFFSSNSDEGRKQGAMFLLIDSFIKRYAGSEMMFDFNGSNDPGVARFYKGFGAELRSYQRIRQNRLHFPFRLLKR